MTDRQTHIKEAVEYLKNYIDTYDKQGGYLDYSDETLIDDVLYGLGVALNSGEWQMADGFKKFKQRLKEHLEK